MLPPTPIRRLLLVPLVVVIACALAALTPAVALLTAAFNLIRRRARRARPRRSRLLRVAWLGLAWSAGETAALTVSLCLWLVSGFGGRLDTEPYQARHYAVMKWFLDLIYRAARRACGLSVTVTGPAGSGPRERPPAHRAQPPRRPGDSLLLIHYLLSVCERRPRVVMKATLQLDPSMDILANRVPNAFLRRRAGIQAHQVDGGTRTGRRSAVGLAGAARWPSSPRAATGPRTAGAGPSTASAAAAVPTWPNARPRCPTSSRRTPAARSPRSRPARPRT